MGERERGGGIEYHLKAFDAFRSSSARFALIRK